MPRYTGCTVFVGRGAQELGTSTLGNKILAQVSNKHVILRYLEPVLGALGCISSSEGLS